MSLIRNHFLRFSWITIVLLAAAPAHGQTVTGSVNGTVTDPAGAVIVSAPVHLTNDISKQVRDFNTNTNGSFEFGSVLPGTYTLKITQTGFKSYEQQGITVSSQERVDLHTIHLSVGDVSTSVEVQAEAAHVATDSSDRSQNVNQIGRAHV